MVYDRNPNPISADWGSRSGQGKHKLVVPKRNEYPTRRQSMTLVRRAKNGLGVMGNAAFARLIGVQNAGTISRWNTGNRRPSNKFLSRILTLALAQMDGVPVSDIAAIHWDMEPMAIVWRVDSEYADLLAQRVRRGDPNMPTDGGGEMKGIRMAIDPQGKPYVISTGFTAKEIVDV